MIQPAKWFSCLLLAALTPSCASVSLHGWAFEQEPRSEVLGFVDGNGIGDALIVRLHGEECARDGIYWMSVSAMQMGTARPSSVPRIFSDAEARDFGRLAVDRPRLARPISAYESWESRWTRIDGYENGLEGLRRVGTSDRKYYVSVVDEAESEAESRQLAKVAVYAHEFGKPGAELKGFAYVPPARREWPRMAVGILLAPAALVLDVATIPVQLVVVPVLIGRALGRAFDKLTVVWIPPLAIGLLKGGALPLRGRDLPVLIATAQGNPAPLALAAFAVFCRPWLGNQADPVSD